jgi:hypothetical protein
MFGIDKGALTQRLLDVMAGYLFKRIFRGSRHVDDGPDLKRSYRTRNARVGSTDPINIYLKFASSGEHMQSPPLPTPPRVLRLLIPRLFYFFIVRG